MKLYVGNLSKDFNDAKLNELIVPFGNPVSATIITDRQTGESRGYGFVEINDATQAQAAIRGLNGKVMEGRSLIVNEARAQKR